MIIENGIFPFFTSVLSLFLSKNNKFLLTNDITDAILSKKLFREKGGLHIANLQKILHHHFICSLRHILYRLRCRIVHPAHTLRNAHQRGR